MSAAGPVLEAEHLVKHFPLVRSAADYLRRAPPRAIHAVDDVSFSIGPGETLGLIGESGSGKSTLGWLVTRLLPVTSGSLKFEGEEVGRLSGHDLRAFRRNVQIVFQDPAGSLDPRMRVWQIVSEPIWVQEALKLSDLRRGRGTGIPKDPAARARALAEARSHVGREYLRARVEELLPTVGLPHDCLDQYSHEFSGGGRQRLSLARALSVQPKLVVLDEPTSALDVAVQAQILNRLVALQRERGYAYLLITHNVTAVRYAADRVAVIYLGQIVEVGPVRGVLEGPAHPYTKALLAAVPVADPRRRRVRYRIGGEIPTMVRPPPGCRFAGRCPFVIERCKIEDPVLRPVPGHPERQAACHRLEEVAEVPPASLLVDAAAPAAG